MVPTPSRQQQVRSRLGARPVLSRLLNELPLETRVEDRHAEEIKPTTATDSELSCKVRTRRSNQLGLNCLDFAQFYKAINHPAGYGVQPSPGHTL